MTDAYPYGPHTLVDTHVHIHESFDLSYMLGCALGNFDRHAGQAAEGRLDGILCLTESQGVDSYATLLSAAQRSETVGEWRLSTTDDPEAVLATRPTGGCLAIIAGRQIVTSERLEILALGTLEKPLDGQPIRHVIRSVQAAGAVCVLPWGFGKWTGNRGEIVRDLIDKNTDRNFFLGDNSGRLSAWPQPAEFSRASARDIPILAGSDPLPWSSQSGAAGRYGSRANTAIDRRAPATALRDYLLSPDRHVETFGKLESIVPFIVHQVGMQLRNRFG